jgi:hypothetical protein
MQPQIDAARRDLEEGKTELRGLQAEVSELGAEVRDLLRSEMALARAETKEQLGIAVHITVWGLAGLVMGFIALVWVAVTATLALANVLDAWAAALIVTAALAGLAVVFAMMAKSSLGRLSVVPKRTANSIKEDISWAKQQLKSKPATG